MLPVIPGLDDASDANLPTDFSLDLHELLLADTPVEDAHMPLTMPAHFHVPLLAPESRHMPGIETHPDSHLQQQLELASATIMIASAHNSMPHQLQSAPLRMQHQSFEASNMIASTFWQQQNNGIEPASTTLQPVTEGLQYAPPICAGAAEAVDTTGAGDMCMGLLTRADLERKLKQITADAMGNNLRRVPDGLTTNVFKVLWPLLLLPQQEKLTLRRTDPAEMPGVGCAFVGPNPLSGRAGDWTGNETEEVAELVECPDGRLTYTLLSEKPSRRKRSTRTATRAHAHAAIPGIGCAASVDSGGGSDSSRGALMERSVAVGTGGRWILTINTRYTGRQFSFTSSTGIETEAKIRSFTVGVDWVSRGGACEGTRAAAGVRAGAAQTEPESGIAPLKGVSFTQLLGSEVPSMGQGQPHSEHSVGLEDVAAAAAAAIAGTGEWAADAPGAAAGSTMMAVAHAGACRGGMGVASAPATMPHASSTPSSFGPHSSSATNPSALSNRHLMPPDGGGLINWVKNKGENSSYTASNLSVYWLHKPDQFRSPAYTPAAGRKRSLQEQEQAGDGAAGTKGLAAAPSGHSPAEQALAAHTKQHAGERLGKLVAHRDVQGVQSHLSDEAFLSKLGPVSEVVECLGHGRCLLHLAFSFARPPGDGQTGGSGQCDAPSLIELYRLITCTTCLAPVQPGGPGSAAGSGSQAGAAGVMAAQADAAGVMAALGGASGGGGVTGVDQVLGRGSTWHKLMAHVNVNKATPMVTLCHFVGTPSHGDEVQAAYASLLEEVLGDFGRSGCSADTLRLHWELLTTQSKSGWLFYHNLVKPHALSSLRAGLESMKRVSDALNALLPSPPAPSAPSKPRSQRKRSRSAEEGESDPGVTQHMKTDDLPSQLYWVPSKHYWHHELLQQVAEQVLGQTGVVPAPPNKTPEYEKQREHNEALTVPVLRQAQIMAMNG